MSSRFRYLALAIALVAAQPALFAQEIVLRAGRLLRCTLEEPNLSSRTAQIGEPIVCYAQPIREFGRSVFPRGSYLTGRLVDYRDPGRLAGKGWLKLEFDRLILCPTIEVPVAAKVVAARGFRIDAEGRILGRGHPKRDALGWFFPPLWPIKLMTLSARGPRPTLKGETPITLRLMDDVSVPCLEPNDRRSPR